MVHGEGGYGYVQAVLEVMELELVMALERAVGRKVEDACGLWVLLGVYCLMKRSLKRWQCLCRGRHGCPDLNGAGVNESDPLGMLVVVSRIERVPVQSPCVETSS